MKFIEQTRFSLELFQRVIISQKIVDGVTVLVLCTLSDTSYFCIQFTENIFDCFLTCKADTIFILIISKGHYLSGDT